jgi:hypothetical protein
MTFPLRKPILLVAVAGALVVTGCGDSGEPEGEPLPSDVTQTLLQQLESVGDRVGAGVSGACDDIYADPPTGNIEPIDDALAAIPADVDQEVRSALEESIDRLKQLVDSECSAIGAAEQEETETPTEEEAPVETVPDETVTEPTDTETVPDEETTPEPQDPEQPPDGRGPDGDGPPGLDRGGAEAPGGDE